MHRLLVCLSLLAAPVCASEFVHAVEFPYHQYPRHLWERELVWLKNIGVKTVALKPVLPKQSDPRTDAGAFLEVARGLGLDVWIRESTPATAAALKPYKGNPIRYADSADLGRPVPSPVTRVSALDGDAWKQVQDAVSKSRGTLLWTDVEDVLTPVLRKGAVSFTGDEANGAKILRRSSALIRFWGELLSTMNQRRRLATPPAMLQISRTKGPGMVLLNNASKTAFAGGVRVWDPAVGRVLRIPKLNVPAGVSLWMPVNVPFRWPGVCEDCGVMAETDRLLYATAELQSVEYENGILAFEFHAPFTGEAVLQLSKKPQGPVLAAGHPAEFEWEAASSAARIEIPAGKAPLYRQRVAIALDVGESAAFFTGNRERLIQGIPNRVVTSYSSETVAGMAKFIAPEGYQVKEASRSQLTVEYEVTPPPSALHGEFITLGIDYEGVRLAKTRAQVLAPITLRLREAEPLRLGADRSLPLDPPVIPVDPRGGRNVTIVFRNNLPSIVNFKLAFSGDGVSTATPAMETSVGAAAERDIPIRVFLADSRSAEPRTLKVHVDGPAKIEREFRFVPMARGQAISYAVDLDGDGVPDPVLENSTVRAAFSGADGRWIEYLAKDRGANLLPEAGLLPLAGPPAVRQSRDGASARITFSHGRVARTFTLSGTGSRVAVSQDTPLSAASWPPERRQGLELLVEQSGPGQIVFQLQGSEP